MNSLKIKWDREGHFVHYNARLLKKIFSVFGTVKKVELIEYKNKALIEFGSTKICEQVYEEYQNKDRTILDALKVKFALNE